MESNLHCLKKYTKLENDLRGKGRVWIYFWNDSISVESKKGLKEAIKLWV